MEIAQTLQYMNPVLACVMGLLWFICRENKTGLKETYKRLSKLEADTAVSSEKFNKIEKNLERILQNIDTIKQILAEKK